MTRFASPLRTFGDARCFLGNSDSKRIGHNTDVVRRADDRIAVRYHSTDVITYHSDGRIAFSTGGWYSVTTKVRLNALSPCSVYSEGAGDWAITGPTGDSARFEDGIVLDSELTFQNWKEARFLLRESRARRAALEVA